MLLSSLSAACQRTQESVEVLAGDVEIHLGDQNDLVAPWQPLYRHSSPSTSWQGEFFVRRPGNREWLLTMDVLQLNDWGNSVKVNDSRLQPRFLPARETDWASTWTRVTFVVPRGVLQPERNVLAVEIGQWVPVFQSGTNFWEDLQFRNVSLRPRS